MPDTIVDEIRKVRDEYANRFNYDLHAMCSDLRREQELSGAEVVSFIKKNGAVPPSQPRDQPGTDKPAIRV
ncbi:MAG: hypothetical protein ACR2FY_15430 [Pirellulaceae bacterium]